MARPGRTIRSETITSEVAASRVTVNVNPSNGGTVTYRFEEVMTNPGGKEVGRKQYADLSVNIADMLGKSFELSDGSTITGAQVFEAFELQGDELVAEHEAGQEENDGD